MLLISKNFRMDISRYTLVFLAKSQCLAQQQYVSRVVDDGHVVRILYRTIAQYIVRVDTDLICRSDVASINTNDKKQDQ
jgi:hypothetical protein